MLSDQELGDTLSRELHELVCDLSPRSDLADRVVRRRRAGRQRAGLAGIATGLAAIAATAVAIGGSGTPAPAQLRLASFTFRLPRGSHAVTTTPAACAFAAGFVYIQAPGEGASDANQPAIAQAVTGAGGCVSMLLSDPYTPGAASAPHLAVSEIIDQRAIQIGSHSGTIGTYAIIGSDMTDNGVPIPSGTRKTVLTLHLPAGKGQTEDLQVAAAGVSEQQLIAIVSSGLDSQESGSSGPATTP